MITSTNAANEKMSFYNISYLGSFVAGLLGLFVWQLILTVYRLYLSPIAHFPGPKLAALTPWYEIYHDIYLNGQFTLHVKELHEKYGKRLILHLPGFPILIVK